REEHPGREMNRTFLQLTFAAVVGSMPSTVWGADPLRLHELLDSVSSTHPSLEQAQRKREAAEGKALSARGGFDPYVSLKGKWTPVGYYETAQLDASIQQATPIWGASVYAGY